MNEAYQNIEYLAASNMKKEWQNPVGFTDCILTPFALSALPDPMKDYVCSVANFTETPIEMAAMCSLGVLSACVAGSFEAEVTEGYREPLPLWVLSILESGNRKSSVHDLLTAPLMEWQQDQAEKIAPRLREATSRRKSDEAVVQGLRAKLARVELEADRRELILEITEREMKLLEIPKEPVLIASDITPERLGVLMQENGERMAIFSDEGGFFEGLGRYSNGVPNLDLYLKGHAGTRERVDRGSRPAVNLERPSLVICLSPQPDVLAAAAKVPAFRGRGLLARFLMVCPRSPLGRRHHEGSPISYAAKEHYRLFIRKMLSLVYEADGLTLRQRQVVKFSQSAYDLQRDLARSFESDLVEGGKFYVIRDWMAKLPGAAARIAALFHIANNLDRNPCETHVSEEDMVRAVQIVLPLISHAQSIFGYMGADQDEENAKVILRWIKNKNIKEFNRSECHGALQWRFKNADQLEKALKILEERNFVDEVFLDGKISHRRPCRYSVSPFLQRDSNR